MTRTSDEQLLVDTLATVPHARGYAVDAVTRLGHPGLAGDVRLIVTELATNALLHAGPPVVLRLLPIGGGIRVEVADSVRTAPVRVRASTDAMTGRGLALVEALATTWGVQPTADGKVVWCELHADGQSAPVEAAGADIDALLAAWTDEEHEKRFQVHLGNVPTRLLLAAKAHVDNVVREFTLTSSGAESGHTAAVPAHLAQLIETVMHRFADARDAIKRQALAAARRGDTRTDLTLMLPLAAADAGEDYLTALDQVDAYARAARLLLLESPQQHRVFRFWYVHAIVDQLRAAAQGHAPPPLQTFEERLLDEIDVLAAARRASDRAARLQVVTASLAAAATVDEVAEVVVREGLAVLGAAAGALVQQAAGHLAVRAAVNYPVEVLAALESESPDAELPAAVAMRTGQPVWIESRAERDQRFPALVGLEPSTVAMCAVPLRVATGMLGSLRWSFESPRLFDPDERRFVQALAAQTAQALDRSILYAAERVARAAAERSRSDAEALAHRLSRLQSVTAELVGADEDRVADIVTAHAAEALGADRALLALLETPPGEPDSLRVVRTSGIGQADQQRWRSFPLDAELPGSLAVRSGQPVVATSRDELERRFPLMTGELTEERSVVCVPLQVRGRSLGVLSLSFPAEHAVDEAEVAFIASLADASAQALDRARALRTAAALTDRLAFLADASVTLTQSLDYRETLAAIARLVVPRLADWCAVDVVEEGALRTVTVAHVNPTKVAFAEELLRRYPPDRSRPAGVPEVVRTGYPEIVARITDEMLVAGTQDAEHLRLARQLELSSALIVPLTGRSGTFGAISLFYAAPGRHFGPEDVTFAGDLARRAALAVEHAREYRTQTGRLAAVQRFAEAAQHAILAPVPERVGPLHLAAAYVGAAEEALVGGDLYEVVRHGDGARLLIGDVRGKGLDAVRLTTVVLGEFRAIAGEFPDLADVARRMDGRVASYLSDEDFVTALLMDVHADGQAEVVSCGHPPALLARDGSVSEIDCLPGLPLGLGATPTTSALQLAPGDRLLLYTDGLIEARDASGRFADAARVVAPLPEGPLDGVLDRILRALRRETGGALADDLALVAAEFRP